MTMRNSLLTVLGSVMLLGAALPAHSESVLRIGLGADPDMLDPHLARTYYGRFVFASLCDRLVDVDEHLKVVPGLAKSWAWSEDGKTLTMDLREGVTFHDGEKFDAAAAKYNLDRALTLKGSLRKSEISSVESVEVTGPMQIALHLKTPDAALLMQLTDRAGALDLTEGIAASDVKTVEADSKLALAKVTGLGYQGITFNINNGKVPANDPFKDARVREAFSQAIDRDALNQVVFEGLYTPANQAFSPVSPYHVNLPVPPRDVDKAKALLKAAGVTTPLSVNLLVPNNPTSQQVGQVLQAMVAEAGFNLNLQMTEFATLLDRQQSGDYQLSFSGWSGRPDPDGSIYGFINSKGTLNDGRYSNAQIDEWLTQARQSTDQAARQPLYDKVVKQLQTDMPIAYLYFEPRIFGLNKNVQGFKPYPDGIVRLAGLTLAK